MCSDNVEQAYRDILRHQPDALLLDIKLRGGDAFQLLTKFDREERKCPPVIMMTGFTEFEYVQRAINDHRDKVIKVLQKPFWENFDEEFDECIEALEAFRQSQKITTANGPSGPVYVKNNSVTYRLELEDIDYIEVGGGGTIIIVRSNEEKYSGQTDIK